MHLHDRPVGCHRGLSSRSRSGEGHLLFLSPFAGPHHFLHLQPVSQDVRHKARGYWVDRGGGGVRGHVCNPVKGET